MSDFDVTDKVCIVTGAGRGIGRGIAQSLARHGATVVLTGRTAATLAETAAAIGAAANSQLADVAREADVTALRDVVLAWHGRIDVLVDNPSINPVWRGIEKISLADWQAIIDIKLTGTFLCCKYLGGAMGQGLGDQC